MVQISLIDNKLTKDDPNDRMAMVQNRKKKTVDDIVKQLTAQGSILKETECEAVIKATLKTIARNVEEGYEFKSDYFDLSFGVSGVFINDDDRFDPSRHQVELGIRLGMPMKEALSKVKVEIIPHNTPMPVITKVFDRKSKTTNDRLTPGYPFDIMGDLLKISDETSEEQGVYLVNTQKAEEFKIAYYYQNTSKSLQVELPESLKKGIYRLEVRTAVYNIKEVRTGFAPFNLTVE